MKYNHNRRRSGRSAAALLSAVMLGTSLPFLSGCKTQITMTVEAGDPLPNAAVLTCVDTSAYVDDVDKNCINHAGTYVLPIKDADGNLYELKLVVRDRTKPVVTPRHLYCRSARPPRPPTSSAPSSRPTTTRRSSSTSCPTCPRMATTTSPSGCATPAATSQRPCPRSSRS